MPRSLRPLRLACGYLLSAVVTEWWDGLGPRMGGEFNYRHQLLDEICLEGLDGITLQVGLVGWPSSKTPYFLKASVNHRNSPSPTLPC